MDALNAVKNAKKKAANLLFEEIEHDVMEKEKFVVEQTEKLREMNESFFTMLDYEKVLEVVREILPKIQAGQVGRGERPRGQSQDEEVKGTGGHGSVSINSVEKQPLLGNADDNVFITNVAGTIEVDEKARLKKLLFRATRGKALTFFQDYNIQVSPNQP